MAQAITVRFSEAELNYMKVVKDRTGRSVNQQLRDLVQKEIMMEDMDKDKPMTYEEFVADQQRQAGIGDHDAFMLCQADEGTIRDAYELYVEERG